LRRWLCAATVAPGSLLGGTANAHDDARPVNRPQFDWVMLSRNDGG
jgi:hypothetical protein